MDPVRVVRTAQLRGARTEIGMCERMGRLFRLRQGMADLKSLKPVVGRGWDGRREEKAGGN